MAVVSGISVKYLYTIAIEVIDGPFMSMNACLWDIRLKTYTWYKLRPHVDSLGCGLVNVNKDLPEGKYSVAAVDSTRKKTHSKVLRAWTCNSPTWESYHDSSVFGSHALQLELVLDPKFLMKDFIHLLSAASYENKLHNLQGICIHYL